MLSWGELCRVARTKMGETWSMVVDGGGAINQVQLEYSLETIGGVLAELIKATAMRIFLTQLGTYVPSRTRCC